LSVVVLHTGVRPPQFALLVQPLMQVCVVESHRGALAGQLPFVRHCTHDPPPVHTMPAGQLVLLRHCTQPPIVVLQWGLAAGHWASLVHPAMHWPVAVSQTGVLPLQLALEVHAAAPSGPPELLLLEPLPLELPLELPLDPLLELLDDAPPLSGPLPSVDGPSPRPASPPPPPPSPPVATTDGLLPPQPIPIATPVARKRAHAFIVPPAERNDCLSPTTSLHHRIGYSQRPFVHGTPLQQSAFVVQSCP
jgi:hypothetical protein